MALGNYTELQAFIETRAKHTGITADIPDFIAMAEAKLNTKLRLREQEQMAYADTTADRYYQLPTGFIELLDLRMKEQAQDDRYLQPLLFTSPQEISRYYGDSSRPSRYTLRKNLELNRIPDQTYRLQMHYLKSWDIATELTNWLLTNYPQIYVFATLVEVFDHLEYENKLAISAAKLQAAIEEAQALDERSRNDAQLDGYEYAQSLGTRTSFDINRGY